MLRRWYLVQICMEATIEIEPQYLDSGKYYANFLAKHPGDANFSDEESRWWPDWYRYSRDSSGDIVFGDRILFRPGIFPNSSKYIQWADTVDLSDPAVLLSGPFDFEPITSSNRTRSKVALTQWRILHDICNSRSILPPTLGEPLRFTREPSLVIRKNRKRRRD